MGGGAKGEINVVAETGKDSPVNVKLLHAGGRRVGEYVWVLLLNGGISPTVHAPAASKIATSLPVARPTTTATTLYAAPPSLVRPSSPSRFTMR